MSLVLLIGSVALRKESVDRNPGFAKYAYGRIKSLSARRAWIEIKSSIEEVSKYVVALRKESVDRNDIRDTTSPRPSMSLSARRAWIEIIDYIIDYVNDASLSARRAWIEI